MPAVARIFAAAAAPRRWALSTWLRADVPLYAPRTTWDGGTGTHRNIPTLERHNALFGGGMFIMDDITNGGLSRYLLASGGELYHTGFMLHAAGAAHTTH